MWKIVFRRRSWIREYLEKGVMVVFPSQTYEALLANCSCPQPVWFLLGGRLLAFDPQNRLDDGLAGEVTQGFFDDCNIPAWDTWISYVIEDEARCPFNAYLLSWVPEALVESVEAGIHVNMEECICWVSDLETVFVRQIRQAGLIR